MKRETYRTCLDPIIQMLEELPKRVPASLVFDLVSTINSVRLQMRFFKMFFWGLAYWEELEYDWHLHFTFSTMVSKLSQTAEQFIADVERVGNQHQEMNWEEMSYELEKIIKQFKPQVKQICILLLNGAFKCKSCQHNQMKLFLEYGRETVFFLDLILQNLEALLFPIDLVAPVKQQVVFIQWKLKEFGNFSNPDNHSITRVKNFGELISRARTWVDHISCLACLYWIDGMDESLKSTLGIMLSDLMHKTMRYTPGVVASYLEGTVIPQLLASYVDFLLEELVMPMIFDVEALHEGLIFLFSFFVNPPEEDSEDRELILAQIYTIINEFPYLIRSIHFDKVKEGICEVKLSGFLQKIDGLKVEVRDMHVMTPHSTTFNSPRTNAIGFLDSFLGTLKKMLEANVKFIPLTKYLVEIVQRELVLLRPFLQSNTKLQNEHGELKELWTRTVDVVYYAAYVTNLCSAKNFPVWYTIVGLPNVIKDIKLIKTQIKKIEHPQIHESKSHNAQMESSIALPPHATTSKIEGAFIGFEEDVRSIIDHLLRGRKDLTIVSISGMPGQGKTTLAKKIFNDPSVQHYFHKIVWSYVSKECTMRELLIKIARDVTDIDNELILKLQDYDLVERLWKSLKRQRYLIVMDDIWEVEVWHQVQGTFPNDKNGSRILFTSRNHDLASQARPNSISHNLRLFTDGESWELIKEKLFHYDCCPPELLEIGRQIAIYCKGLPLAVSLIAAVLTRTEQNLDTWNQLADDLKSHLTSEGCRNIIELSYKNLPDHLKPCFLYFGAFPRGENVRARKLNLLWIAEGFIKDNEIQSLEDLANGYLNNLVSQSLVVVTERSSTGKIKKCNVHDLLYDLCLEKAVEENFLHWAEESTVIDQCNCSPQKFNHHRLCIGKSDSLIKPRPIVIKKELPTSQVHSLLWFSHLGNYSFVSLHNYFPCFLESFRVLTVLDLEGVLLGFDRHPEVIIFNIHLRYLALKFSGMMSLPSSISDLWNLETLIVNAEGLVSLPVSIWKMKSLKHVDVKYFRLELEDFEESNSFAAYKIETLGAVFVVYDAKTEEFLMKLPRLKKLRCYVDGGDELHPMWFSMFGSLNKLESLRIESSYKKISTFDFPKIDNLKKLTLSGIQLPWSMMSIIGKQLPNLEVLKLTTYACSGSSWDVEDGDFSKLKYLKLEYLEIERIDLSGCDNPYPCLEELVVNSCTRLEEIPSCFGEISTLNTIKVLGFCSSKAKRSAQRVLEEQKDLGNFSLRVIVEGDNEGEKEEELHEGDDEEEESHDEGDEAEEKEEDDDVDGREESEENARE